MNGLKTKRRIKTPKGAGGLKRCGGGMSRSVYNNVFLIYDVVSRTTPLKKGETAFYLFGEPFNILTYRMKPVFCKQRKDW